MSQVSSSSDCREIFNPLIKVLSAKAITNNVHQYQTLSIVSGFSSMLAIFETTIFLSHLNKKSSTN